ncbi:MAG TPA: ABC transporter substrate-binding protein [Clostridia bacterium]|nr:ABC transporter substrate-binding protein [Clostridia bacterium]
MRKGISVLLVIILVLAMFTGCTKPNSEPAAAPADPGAAAPEKKEVKTIRVASLPSQISLPLYYISKQGWDVENGFKIDLTTFPSGAPVNEALGADLWDVSAIGAAAVMSVVGYDAIQIFSHVDAGEGINAMVRKDSPILKVKGYNPAYPEVYGDPETLKGATILLPVGSGSHFQISKWIEAMGLKETDVKLVHMDYAQGFQAFKAGEGDIVCTSYPFTPKLVAEGYVTASSMKTLNIPYFDNIVVNRKYYDGNKDVLVSLMEQLLRAADVFRSDEELYVDAMMEWYKLNGQEMDKENVRAEVTKKPFVTSVEAKTHQIGASLKMQAQFMASIGKIKNEDLNKFDTNIKTEILEETVKRFK